MKYLLPIVVITLLLIGAYFIINRDLVATEGAASGVVTAVSFEDVVLDGPARITFSDENNEERVIAVPSMGLPLCAAKEAIADVYEIAVGDYVSVRGALDEEGSIVPCERDTHYLIVTSVMQDAAYGFSFEYRKGPNGYVTLEDTESTDPSYVTGVTLLNAHEYELLMQSTDAREGPPAMHVRVYRNDEKLHAPVWAMRYPRESNIELALNEPQEVVVGGANASFYVTDGLYPTEVYVVASGDHMYVLMGSYLDMDSTIYQDFQELVASFTFIAPHAPQGKIDPRVACKSALLYMTFESGEAADAFVAACINGEFPEVIDRYIRERGWDGAVI